MVELKNLGHCNITMDLLKTTLNKNGHYNINIDNHLRHNSLIQSHILCPPKFNNIQYKHNSKQNRQNYNRTKLPIYIHRQ